MPQSAQTPTNSPKENVQRCYQLILINDGLPTHHPAKQPTITTQIAR